MQNRKLNAFYFKNLSDLMLYNFIQVLLFFYIVEFLKINRSDG